MTSLKEDIKREKYLSQFRTRCKCGHTVLITSKDGKTLCTWCHRYVFASEEIENEYRKEEFKKKLRRDLNE